MDTTWPVRVGKGRGSAGDVAVPPRVPLANAPSSTFAVAGPGRALPSIAEVAEPPAAAAARDDVFLPATPRRRALRGKQAPAERLR